MDYISIWSFLLFQKKREREKNITDKKETIKVRTFLVGRVQSITSLGKHWLGQEENFH